LGRNAVDGTGKPYVGRIGRYGDSPAHWRGKPELLC